MPPKADPYATPLHRRIDAALVFVTILLLVFVMHVSARQSASSANAIGGLRPSSPVTSAAPSR